MVPLKSTPPHRSHRSHRFAATVLVAFVFLAPVIAGAAVDPERIADDQTGWYYLSNVTEAQINQLVNDEGARLIDIEIYDTSPLRFAASFVANQGTFASGWWWYFGLSLADVDTRLTANNARLIDIERYEDGGGEKFAVVMVPNTGAQQKAWWYYVGVSPADITAAINTNNARLVDLESYDTATGRRYAAIMIRNLGEDAAGWAWFYNTDFTTVNDYMNANNMRMLEFEMRDPATPTMDAVLIDRNYNPPRSWWWYYNVPFAEIDGLAAQAGSRIVDLDVYDVGGQKRFNLVLLNNASDLTVEIASILEWGSDGDTGVYLRQINGPTLASLQPDFGFEPASAIKATHHLTAMRDVMAGNISLATPITYSINYNGSCPIGGAPSTTQPLQEVLRRMMVNSDNAATNAIANLYGFAAITNTAQNIAGMTGTNVNHTLGCAAAAIADPNVLTLRDAGELYERVETLQILSEPMRDTYYGLMQNQDTPSPWWFTTDLESTVDEVATTLGLPAAAGSFWAAVRTAWKPGGYTLNFGGTNHEYVAVAGIVSLPSCTRWPTVIYRDYVFGVFVHDGSDNADAFDRVQSAAKELFRDVIADAMRTCPTPVPDDLPVLADAMLERNYPNPFNPSTQLVFNVARPQQITLTVYDSAGRRLAVVADRHFQPGRHVATWSGRDDAERLAPAGIYFARLVADERVESLKMALIK